MWFQQIGEMSGGAIWVLGDTLLVGSSVAKGWFNCGGGVKC